MAMEYGSYGAQPLLKEVYDKKKKKRTDEELEALRNRLGMGGPEEKKRKKKLPSY